VEIVAYQNVDLADYGVTETDVLEGPVLVRTDGSHVIGPLGMAEMLRSARAPVPIHRAFHVAPWCAACLTRTRSRHV